MGARANQELTYEHNARAESSCRIGYLLADIEKRSAHRQGGIGGGSEVLVIIGLIGREFLHFSELKTSLAFGSRRFAVFSSMCSQAVWPPTGRVPMCAIGRCLGNAGEVDHLRDRAFRGCCGLCPSGRAAAPCPAGITFGSASENLIHDRHVRRICSSAYHSGQVAASKPL